jgi:hypothetical protein
LLEETDRLFSCGFCKVRSYLVPQGVFRYRFSGKAPEDKSLFYVPYWRLKGSMFSCVENGIQNRFVDLSHQAVASGFFPSSLGLRSQALKLKFISPGDKGRFLKPVLPVQKVTEIFQARFDAEMTEPMFLQNYVGETVSLIYSPFYADEKIYDAVLNEPTSDAPAKNFDETQFAGGAPDWKMNFLPTLCPDCGWNMEGEKDALVLACQNCKSAWKPDKKGFTRLNIASIPTKEEAVSFFPFWRIKAEISGVELNTFADLVKIANLPKVVQKGWDKIDFYFWIMAFKVRPQNFLTTATNLTLAQPQDELMPDLPAKNVFSATLSLSQAVSSLKLILANFIRPPKVYLPRLNEIVITPKSYLLVYVPFKENHHDFTHLKYPIAIAKNHLAIAKNL